MTEVSLTDFGTAQSVEVSKKTTTIVGGDGAYDKVETQINKLKEEISTEDDLAIATRIQDRITRLSSGVAIIRVGASSEVEMIEKKHRFEDALEAVHSARVEGIVPGGGVTLIEVGNRLTLNFENEEQATALSIFKAALQAPFATMAKNAGMSVDLARLQVENSDTDQGINFATGKVENLIEAGIIDPAKVTRCAIKNAVSVAGTLLLTNHSVIET